MYNGIGLQTPRGSGTNGYVQRNLAFVKSKKDRVDYKTEEEINKLDQGLNKQPNREILDHERKRKVELKCMEMQELMEEQGYSEKEVTEKVNMFRKMLMAKEGVSDSPTVEKDEFGRPLARETHQLAEANLEKNARLKEAFGLADYVEGSAFDPDRKAKEEAAKAAALAQKKYTVVHSSDDEQDKETASSPAKKKKKSRHESTSPERSKEKRKKSRKHSKRDRSHSKRHRKSRRASKKRSTEKKKKRRRHHSSSSSGSVSHGESVDSNEPTHAKSGQDTPTKKINELDHSPLCSQIIPVQGKELSPVLSTQSQIMPQSPKSSPSQKTAQINLHAEHNSNKQAVAKAVAPLDGPEKLPLSRSRSSSHHSHSYRRRSSSLTSYSRSRSRSHSRSRSRSPSQYSRHHTNSKSYSRSRSRSVSSVSAHRSNHRDSRSPSIRRRRGSPSHLDKRRITSARKRPVPYFRPSPSPSPTDSDSSFSPRRSRSRSHASRSRFRSLSGSPSLDLHHRQRKHQQQLQHTVYSQHYPQQPQPHLHPVTTVLPPTSSITTAPSSFLAQCSNSKLLLR